MAHSTQSEKGQTSECGGRGGGWVENMRMKEEIKKTVLAYIHTVLNELSRVIEGV